MKQYSKGTREYNLLKYYWKLYLKPFNYLEKTKLHYEGHLKDILIQEQIVTEGLLLNPVPENTYNLNVQLYGYSNFKHLITRIKLEEKDTILKEKASSYYQSKRQIT